LKKLLALLLLAAPSLTHAGFGKLNLSPVVSPVFIRELHDGNWLAGYAKPDIWKLDIGRAVISDVHIGAFHAWRVNSGDAAVGLSAGLGLPSLGPALAKLGEVLQIPGTIKWISLVEASLSLDFYGGYRPIHGPDVQDWMYGVGGYLKYSFGLPDLIKGY
jgi:hypothetical protein